MKPYFKLFLCIFLDIVGYASYAFPGIGETIDIFWAPLSGFLLFFLFKGTEGVVGGIISSVEEASPGFDFIPTFTLTWLYTHFIAKKGALKNNEIKK